MRRAKPIVALLADGAVESSAPIAAASSAKSAASSLAKAWCTRTLPALGAVLVACAIAAAPPPAQHASSPAPTVAQPDAPGMQAFRRLASLEGRWATTKGFPATFARVGRGAAVSQDSGFFVVWYPDGEALVAALFPDDGYHARLRSTRIVEANGELVAELVAEHVGNVSPKQPIARSLTLTLAPDNATVTERWLFRTDSGDEPFELVLRRAK